MSYGLKVGQNKTVKDMFKTVVDNMQADPGYIVAANLPAPKFYYGYWDEIANILMVTGQKQYAFPAIILHANIPYKAGADYRYSGEISPSIYIISQTRNTYAAIDRIETIYKPILYPLLERFIEELKKSHFFNTIENGREVVTHEANDLIYLNSEPKNQNKLNDFVDTIEIKFSGLKIFKKQIFKIN